MKRTLIHTLLGFGLIATSSATLADGWKLFPVMNANYQANLTVSAVGGALNSNSLGNGGYTGIEAAFNCLALQPPTGVIRSKISYGQFDQNGMKLNTFEVNPRWTTEISKNLSLGIGPGVGWVQVDTGAQTNNLAAVQLGADVDYRIGALNLGLAYRWQGTANTDLGNGKSGVNNDLVQAKIGVNF